MQFLGRVLVLDVRGRRVAQSDFFYFVADAQGHHRFAHSFEEHNKNVAAYRKAMRKR